MPFFDEETKEKMIVALNGAVIASSTTTDGATIDLNAQGAESVTFHLRVSAYTDGTYTPLIEESTTGAFIGEEVAVDDKFLTRTEASRALTAANTVSQIGYIGAKRYVRLTVVSTGVTSGAHVSANAELRHLRTVPIA